MHALVLVLNLCLSLAAICLVLSHKGRDGGLGGPAGGGLAVLERPRTRALVAVVVIWAASSALEALWR